MKNNTVRSCYPLFVGDKLNTIIIIIDQSEASMIVINNLIVHLKKALSFDTKK